MRLLEGRGPVLALASNLLVLGLVAAPAASAAPGDFDSSFGLGGTAVSQLNTGSAAATEVADVIVDSAGRILVAGIYHGYRIQPRALRRALSSQRHARHLLR